MYRPLFSDDQIMRAHQDFSQSPFHIARMGFTDLSYSDQSWLLTKYAMIVVIGAAIISLIVLSELVRDTDYIRRYPKYFATEVLIVAVGGALPLLFVAYCRGSRVSSLLWAVGREAWRPPQPASIVRCLHPHLWHDDLTRPSASPPGVICGIFFLMSLSNIIMSLLPLKIAHGNSLLVFVICTLVVYFSYRGLMDAQKPETAQRKALDLERSAKVAAWMLVFYFFTLTALVLLLDSEVGWPQPRPVMLPQPQMMMPPPQAQFAQTA
jgi:hypothetical protein